MPRGHRGCREIGDQLAAFAPGSGHDYWIIAGVVAVFAALLYGVKRWMATLEHTKGKKDTGRLAGAGAVSAA